MINRRNLFIIAILLFLCGCLPVSNNIKSLQNEPLDSFCEQFDFNGPDNIDDTYFGDKRIWEYLNNYYQNSNRRKLIVFMDGTSNDAENPSNIRRLYKIALQNSCKGEPVIPYYDKGVGSHKYDKITGNAFGNGVSLNIRQAYRFLMDTYQKRADGEDEIFIFGFSRGAFTARSLNGFIEHAGLIDKTTLHPYWYEKFPVLNSMTKHHKSVAALYDAYNIHADGQPKFEERLKEIVDNRRAKFDDRIQVFRVKVKAIGVFDTVPAFGLARKSEPDNHRLDFYALKGFHALSLDEQRRDFNLLRFNNDASEGGDLEEVWFPGVHANVGGGYLQGKDCSSPEMTKNCMEIIPLNWMIRSFKNYSIFYSGTVFVQCDDGILHDEYLDNKLYDNFGSIKRKPLKGDKLHISVVKRINIEKLPSPHPHREPDGKYRPENLVLPLTQGYYQIVE